MADDLTTDDTATATPDAPETAPTASPSDASAGAVDTNSAFDAALDKADTSIKSNLQAQSNATAANERPDQKLDDLMGSLGLGAVKGLVDTANFVGDVLHLPKGHGVMNSPILSNVYAQSAELDRRGMANGFADGAGQFAVGMLGVGKVFDALKIGELASKAGVIGKAGEELAKGFGAAYTALDPHQGRLSDLIEQMPQLRNPVNQYLASNPDDSDSTSRLKNALEGAGLDLATSAVLGAALKTFKVAKAVADGKAPKAELDTASQQLDQTIKDGGQPTPEQSNQTSFEDAYGKVQQQQAQEATGTSPAQTAEVQNQGSFEKAYGDLQKDQTTTAHPDAATGDMEKAYGQYTDLTADSNGNPLYTTPPKAVDAGSAPADIPRAVITTGKDEKPVSGAPNAPSGVPTGDASIAQAIIQTARDNGDLKGRIPTDVVQKAISAAPDLVGKPPVEVNGVKLAVIPHQSMINMGKAMGVDASTWLGAAHPKQGVIVLSDKLLKEAPAMQATVIAHEVGHLLEPQLLDKLKATGQTLDTAELKAASREVRPDQHGSVDSAVAAGNGNHPTVKRISNYLNSTRETFADSFSLWKNNPQLMAKVAPSVKAIFDQHFQPWIDTDLTTLAGDTQVARRRGEVGQPVATGAPIGRAVPDQMAAKPGFSPRMEMEDSDVGQVLGSYKADQDALLRYGSRADAEAAGYRFATSNIPWQKLSADGGYKGLHDRVASELKASLDQMKGGDVLHDERVDQLVKQRVQMFNENASDVFGEIQAMGHNANSMVANMEAAFAISNKVGGDVYQLVKDIDAGNYAKFGGDEAAAKAALKDQLALYVEAIGNAQAMRAAIGRGMRRLRGDFKVDPKVIASIKSMDPDGIANIVRLSEGDPRRMAALATQSFWDRAIRAAGTLYANNLLWLWPTHARNMIGNVFMLGTTPAMRAVGSLVQGSAGADVRTIALREYRYMFSTLGDSFESAVQAYLHGDSVLNAHSNEYFRSAADNMPTSAAGKIGASLGMRPMNNVGDVLANGFKGISFLYTQPTRALGMADEFMKQMSYRGSVLAKASLDADKAGLEGQAYRDYLQKALSDAFDENGRAVDQAALYDAQVRTFSQPLIQGTMGASTATWIAKHPTARIVLPFVRTPINLFRYAIKMSPGLNLLQKEYRQMLSGALGPTRQADAFGQMMLGSTAAASIAYAANAGMITGGAPPGAAQAKALADTGWKPYSFVVKHDDGTHTYIPFNQVDPIGMLFGLVADSVQIAHQGNVSNATLDQLMLPITISIAKNLVSRTYLQSLQQTLDAVTDPERGMERMIGNTAANMVPFASLMREVNPDPYTRDARSIMDNVMATLPGFSQQLPPRRDAFGYPVNRVNNVVFSDTNEDVVNTEQQRMLSNFGIGVVPPTAQQRNGVDLRDYKLPNGQTAFDRYQEISQKPDGAQIGMKDALGQMIRSPQYQAMPDGDAGMKGTKLNALTSITTRYRDSAFKQLIKENPALAQALGARQQAVREAYRNNLLGQDANAARTNTVISAGLQRANAAFGIK